MAIVLWTTSKYPDKEITVEQDLAVLVPAVGSSYKNGWGRLWEYFLELFLITIIAIVIGIPPAIDGWSGEAFTMLSFLGIIYSILIGGPVGYGVSFAYLKAARGDKLEIKDMFEAFKNYWNAILANLLVSGIVVIGLILLIIPGFIFACKLAFTPYLVVDRKMKAIEAVKESWRMTNGHALKVFLIGLLGIPIMIVGLLALLVGVIPAAIWVVLALSSLYHAVSLTGKTSGQGIA